MNFSGSRYLLFFLLSAAGYVLLGYFIPREQFLLMMSIYVILFSVYVFGLKNGTAGLSENRWFTAAIFFRLLFLFSLPQWSDDFYRFLWDGKMQAMGINPYSQIPSFVILYSDEQNSYLLNLFNHLNSAEYYTVYPPVTQFIFFIAVKLFPTDVLPCVIVIRLFVLLAEIGTIFFLKKIVAHLKLPPATVWLYAFNPLIIIELTGNMHMEALEIFFIAAGFYCLLKSYAEISIRKSWILLSIAAVSFAGAISSKLIPVLLLPFIVIKLPLRKAIYFSLFTGVVTLLFFLPYYQKDVIQNILSSTGLYFQKFEFNSPVYSIVRWIGNERVHYDIIQEAGPTMGFISALLMVILFFFNLKRKLPHLPVEWTWVIFIYLAFSTIVHPWYSTPVIFLSVLAGYRFAVVWSLLIVLSYAAYEQIPYAENYWLEAVEYAGLLALR